MKNNLFSVLVLIFFFSLAAVEFDTTKDLPELYSVSVRSAVRVDGMVKTKPFSELVLEIEAPSYGSGVVVDKEAGLVATVNHVAALLKKTISLSTGVVADCEIIAADKANDLTILKIDPLLLKDISEAKLSCVFKIGEEIYAIGNPLGINDVLTSGIISSKLIKYNFNVEVTYPDGFILSDLRVAGGSSGSAVYNSEGEVVGLVSSSYSGFALIVPSTSIKNLLDSLND